MRLLWYKIVNTLLYRICLSLSALSSNFTHSHQNTSHDREAGEDDFLLNLVIILHYQCNNNWPLVAGITYFYFNTLVVITIKIEII